MVLLSSTLALAKEPTNLAITKQELRKYHDSGAYLDDIANVIQKAMRYLELRVDRGDFNGKKPAIILDIDETALSNYPDLVRLDFGGTRQEILHVGDDGKDEAISPTLKLYRYAKAHGIAVFFLTGRFEESREATAANLKKVGFTNYDGLILRKGEYRNVSALQYKTAYRKQITDQGYDILVNIGDKKVICAAVMQMKYLSCLIRIILYSRLPLHFAGENLWWLRFNKLLY